MIKIKYKLLEIQDWLREEIEDMGGMHIFLLACVVTLVLLPFLIFFFLLLVPSYKGICMLMEAKELGFKTSFRKHFQTDDYEEEQRNKKKERENSMEEKLPKGRLKRFTEWEAWPDAQVVDGVAVYGAEKRTLLYVDESVEEYDIPEGVENIYHRCFSHCTKLRHVGLPKTLKRIGNSAFSQCVSLKEVVIPDSVYVVEEYAFTDCSSLECVVLSAKMQYIPYRMFNNCRRLHDIVLPEAMIRICEEAFRRCYSLEYIKTNEQLLVVGEKAFEDCRSLKEFIMPETMKRIMVGTFDGCHSLEHIHFSSTVKDFGGSCCKGCWNIKRISMPAISEDRMKYYQDMWEKYSDQVDISTSECPLPESMFWTMGDSLFWGVPRLTNVCLVFCFSKEKEYTIPSFVTNVKQEAFSSCKDLRTLRLSPYLSIGADPTEQKTITHGFIYEYWPQIDSIVFDESLKHSKYAIAIIG